MALMHRSMYFGIQLARCRPVGRIMRRLRRWDGLDRESYRLLTERRLQAALAHARAHVPLYSSAAWSHALDGAEADDLRRWPVLERSMVREARTDLIAAPLRASLLTRTSSASTGAPVRVEWNPLAVAWSWAAEYHPMQWHELQIGAKTLRLWGDVGGSLSRAVENFVLNRHFVSTHELTPKALDRALRYWTEMDPPLVWGTPSAVLQLARWAHERGAERTSRKASNAPLKGSSPARRFAKVGGEQVYAFQRADIERHLGVRVLESYGSTEMGPIAAECPAGAMHVLATNVWVEIFRDGAPVAPGTTGEVVATTLVNRGMPLVRCRIGDTASISPAPCRCGLPQPVLTELRARSADVLLAADGRAVHGSVLGEALERYLGIPPLGRVQQILFEQLDQRRWRVHVEWPRADDFARLAEQLLELLRGTFGKDSSAEIVWVERIPREGFGKHRYYRSADSVACRVASATGKPG